MTFTQRQAVPFDSVINGDCIEVMSNLPSASVDFILTDPPYLVNFRDRSGRNIANDDNDAWLKPAFRQMHRVLRPDSLCISFYSWNKADQVTGPERLSYRRLTATRPRSGPGRRVAHP
jgi:site-specific DNA-methyltransferase (adenine-specific)